MAPKEFQTQSLDKLELEPVAVEAVQAVWRDFVAKAGSDEAAGKMVLSALFDLDPDAKSHMTVPKSEMALKFSEGMKVLVDVLGSPAELRTQVDSLGFQLMGVESTVKKLQFCRTAILDTVISLLGDDMSTAGKQGLTQLLTYIGGGLIYIRNTYAERIQVIKESWRIVRDSTSAGAGNARQHEDDEASAGFSGSFEATQDPTQRAVGGSGGSRAGRGCGMLQCCRFGRSPKPSDADQAGLTLQAVAASKQEKSGNNDDEHGSAEASGERDVAQRSGMTMPHSFEEMFQINAAVMGVQGRALEWMQEVREGLDNFVVASSDHDRFRAECDVMTIQLSKYPAEVVNLAKFRSCMLASLRSLLSRTWSGLHEDAWTWLWDSAAAVLQENIAKPPVYERTLETWYTSENERARYNLRRDIYSRFFEIAPAGQEYFKQSNTRLHFIAERVLEMSVEILQRPKSMVSQISALGLRHVGFGIPTDLMPPFVVACVETMEKHTVDPAIVESFSWALWLVSKILIRTIHEGSTVVMRAINSNSVRAIKQASNTAPRKYRATYLLDIQVGDQHISPLSWAIESGSIKVAKAILDDILTIRADRARYYYGIDELWRRHPDIVKKLQDEAPVLLSTLLDGLIWRSHRTKDGQRRVNYYIKNLLMQADGTFSDALESISASGDPTLVSHPTVGLLTDCLWSGIVVRHFVTTRMWNVVSLAIFIASQEILPAMQDPDSPNSTLNMFIFMGRVWNYVVGMGRLAMFHLYRIWVWCRNTMRRIIREIDTDGNGEIDAQEMMEALHKFKDTVVLEAQKAIRALREDGPGTMDEAKKAIANREKNAYTMISFSLLFLLGVMCTHEPMFWCSGAADWPTEYCEHTGTPGDPTGLRYRYSIFTMTAMVVHWLILVDMAVFSTEISAFLLVFGHVLGEVKQFLIALTFMLLAFGSSISILCRNCPTKGGDFNDFPDAVISLFAITVSLYQGDFRDMSENSLLLTAVSTFVTISVILLLNLLVAQLNRSYEYIYQDMLGFAQLNRASLIVDAMEACSRSRFKTFIDSLHFDQRLEFDEGDLGLPGGISHMEDSRLHTQTREAIRRFGGTTSPDAPWPEDKEEAWDEDEETAMHSRLERIERMVGKVLKRSAHRAALAKEAQQASSEDGVQASGGEASTE